MVGVAEGRAICRENRDDVEVSILSALLVRCCSSMSAPPPYRCRAPHNVRRGAARAACRLSRHGSPRLGLRARAAGPPLGASGLGPRRWGALGRALAAAFCAGDAALALSLRRRAVRARSATSHGGCDHRRRLLARHPALACHDRRRAERGPGAEAGGPSHASHPVPQARPRLHLRRPRLSDVPSHEGRHPSHPLTSDDGSERPKPGLFRIRSPLLTWFPITRFTQKSTTSVSAQRDAWPSSFVLFYLFSLWSQDIPRTARSISSRVS